MLSLLSLLLTGALVLIILSAVVAPIESLGWWAGWFGERETPATKEAVAHVPAAAENAAEHFLVYLSGIGAIDGRSIPEEEIKVGEVLVRQLPGTALVGNVYPYSVTNAGLTSQRVFARVWRWIEQRRLRNPNDLLQFLINLRNVFQVAISADRRYGPIYNLGVANEIVEALEEQGYRVGSGKPVTLLGWSGGGQVAVGAAAFLRPLLGAPIRVISIGGVISDDVGLRSLIRLYHYYGDKDPVQALGAKLYAGRWAIAPQSDWNQAMAAGKIEMHSLGPMAHNGAQNYFSWTATLPDGRPHALATIDAITDTLVKEGLMEAAALQQARTATAAQVAQITAEQQAGTAVTA